MTVDNYITALEQITDGLESLKLACCRVIGGLHAEKMKATAQNSAFAGEKVEPCEKSEEVTIFSLKDGTVRKRGGSYEIRFQKLGYRKSFSSTTLEGAQAKFKVFLKELNARTRNGKLLQNKKPSLRVEEWAETYLNKFKRTSLCEKAFQNTQRVIKNHVIAPLGKRILADVGVLELQDLFNSLLEQGKSRTAEDVKTFLSGMFEKAEALGYVKKNPMRAVVVKKHYRKHGAALSLTEERQFLELIKNDCYRDVYEFMLFSGARRSEALLFKLSDVDLDSNVILIHTTKQKDRVNAKPRTVPIFPKLRPVIERLIAAGVEEPFKKRGKTTERFKTFMPERHLHELRHTFTTRCRECGIDNEITSLFTGHAVKGNTAATVYTHFSLEYLQQQALRLVY